MGRQRGAMRSFVTSCIRSDVLVRTQLQILVRVVRAVEYRKTASFRTRISSWISETNSVQLLHAARGAPVRRLVYSPMPLILAAFVK